MSLTSNDASGEAADGMIVRYAAFATITLLVYDSLLTLSEETSSISFAKVITIFNRYLPFATTVQGVIDLMSDRDVSTCNSFMIVQSVLICSSFVVAEGILLMRVYAIWERRKDILIILLSGYFIAVVLAYISSVFYAVSVETIPVHLQQTGCLYVFNGRAVWGALSALLIYETFMISLLITRVFLPRYRLGGLKSSLVRRLYKDGVLFYVCVLFLSVANLISVESAPPALCFFFLTTQGALHSVMCNRLVLRLRGMHSPTFTRTNPARSELEFGNRSYPNGDVTCLTSCIQDLGTGELRSLSDTAAA